MPIPAFHDFQLREGVRDCAIAVLAFLLLAAWPVLPALAQSPDAPIACAPATAEAYLDVGNVRAKILNNGGLFWNGGANAYEVPKGSGVHSIFVGNLWLGGLVDGDLRMAATSYGPWEFWPGPRTEGAVSPETCAEYDRLWEIKTDDLQRDGPLARQRLDEWPVHVGAPFIDVDRDGVYDPLSGDRPEVLGDQQFWWVMNDLGGTHQNTDTEPMQIEVRATAFAFKGAGAIENSTFYRYLIRNTSDRPIVNGYAGLYLDPDLGAAFDDYVGSDTTLGMGFTYNADNNDDGQYGAAPPAFGAMVLKRPRSTMLNDSIVCGYPDKKSSGFTSMLYYNGGGGALGDPSTGRDFYASMMGKWKDGQPVTFGGNGRDFSREPTRFVFPGNPATSSYWSEVNSDERGNAITPADRRYLNGLGPFCMAPGEEVELVIAIVWSRGSSNLDSVRQLKEDVAYIQSIRDGILTPRSIPDQNVPEPEVPLALGVYPNPAGADGATVRLSIPEALDVGIEVYDVLGRHVHAAAGPGRLGGGEHQWTLPTGGWAPGVYIVRIQTGHVTTTRRLVVGKGM